MLRARDKCPLLGCNRKDLAREKRREKLMDLRVQLGMIETEREASVFTVAKNDSTASA